MAVSKNLAVIRNIYEGFARRDFGVIARYFDPEVEIYQTELLPWGCRYHGHDGVVAYFTDVFTNIESQIEIAEMIDAGDHVVETGRARGRSRETGEVFDVANVNVWKLRNGKVVAFRTYVDTPVTAETLETVQ